MLLFILARQSAAAGQRRCAKMRLSSRHFGRFTHICSYPSVSDFVQLLKNVSADSVLFAAVHLKDQCRENVFLAASCVCHLYLAILYFLSLVLVSQNFSHSLWQNTQFLRGSNKRGLGMYILSRLEWSQDVSLASRALLCCFQLETQSCSLQKALVAATNYLLTLPEHDFSLSNLKSVYQLGTVFVRRF